MPPSLDDRLRLPGGPFWIAPDATVIGGVELGEGSGAFGGRPR
jgi:hypothetical protein